MLAVRFSIFTKLCWCCSCLKHIYIYIYTHTYSTCYTCISGRLLMSKPQRWNGCQPQGQRELASAFLFIQWVLHSFESIFFFAKAVKPAESWVTSPGRPFLLKGPHIYTQLYTRIIWKSSAFQHIQHRLGSFEEERSEDELIWGLRILQIWSYTNVCAVYIHTCKDTYLEMNSLL